VTYVNKWLVGCGRKQIDIEREAKGLEQEGAREEGRVFLRV